MIKEGTETHNISTTWIHNYKLMLYGHVHYKPTDPYDPKVSIHQIKYFKLQGKVYKMLHEPVQYYRMKWCSKKSGPLGFK